MRRSRGRSNMPRWDARPVKLRVAGAPADLARIQAVAEALPDGVDIMADANEKCDLARAQWLANVLADVNAFVVRRTLAGP